MASQVSVVVSRRRAAVTFPLDRRVAEQGRKSSPRRSVHRPTHVGGIGSLSAKLPAKAAVFTAMKSRLTLKTMLCADVIQIAADFAGEDERKCTALEELADKGLVTV